MTMNDTAVTVAPQPSSMALTFVMTPQEARQRLVQLQEFVRDVMIPGTDYGVIPGTSSDKPTLFQPGAEKLNEIYGLASTVLVTNRIEIWEGNGFFHYEVSCTLTLKGTDVVVATGLGSCNSKEGRYRWRDAGRKCPHCQSTAIIKGKAEFGGGWLCFRKKGGCGATFNDNDPAIVGQAQGKVENDDVFSLTNTILKMAAKRAKVAATLSATRSSALFTQDMEDFINREVGDFDDAPPPQQRPQNQGQTRGRQQRPPQPPVGRVIDGYAEEVPPPVEDGYQGAPSGNSGARPAAASGANQQATPAQLGICPEHNKPWQPSKRENGSPYHAIPGSGFCNLWDLNKERGQGAAAHA